MIFLFVTLLMFGNTTGKPDIALLRDLYIAAASNEEKARQLIRETQVDNNSPLIKGYSGAAKMLMAKHYLNPFSKLNTFNKGKKLLEWAIKSDSSNPELRYLRLTIQKNAPSFLNYDENIESDMALLSASLISLKDEQLKMMIKNYLSNFPTI